MSQRGQPSDKALPSVSVAFVLAAEPSRVRAFRTAITAVLHAGFSFGRECPGQIVYSYDAQGEDYAEPALVPAGAIKSLADANRIFAPLAEHYNHSIGLAFARPAPAIPVTGRIYDEPGTLIVMLDFEPPHWRQLVTICRSPHAATAALVNAGRTLFTLLPLHYLLIGPSELLSTCSRTLDTSVLKPIPVAMLGNGSRPKRESSMPDALYVEHVPRGSIIVRNWDASAAPQDRPARPRRRGIRRTTTSKRS